MLIFSATIEVLNCQAFKNVSNPTSSIHISRILQTNIDRLRDSKTTVVLRFSSELTKSFA